MHQRIKGGKRRKEEVDFLLTAVTHSGLPEKNQMVNTDNVHAAFIQ
jgi:hypothetical protein